MSTATIKIFSKKAFRFKRPDVNELKIDGKNLKFEDAYFVTVPGEMQTAPAWIKQDLMWQLGAKDGDIMEVNLQTNPDPEQLVAQAAAAQAEQRQRQLEDLKKLDSMNKGELQEYADELDLELAPGMTKADIINAITDRVKGAPTS